MARCHDPYYEWLIGYVYDGRYTTSHSMLLQKLHDEIFRYTMAEDENIESFGRDMRFRYSFEEGEPCPDDSELEIVSSVLEAMVALAIKCEDLKYEYEYGDRTAYWFWSMINSLGLMRYDDSHYDEYEVTIILYNFFERNYDMKKIILIKYGELTTKKDNINFFLTTLKDNLKVSLKGFLILDLFSFSLANFFPKKKDRENK